MSFGARDRFRSGPFLTHRPEPAGDPLLDALHLALGDVDTQLRREMPDLFAAVDEVKAQPDRKPQTIREVGTADQYERRECGWCGDWFVTERRRPVRCCSLSCVRRFQVWSKRRLTA